MRISGCRTVNCFKTQVMLLFRYGEVDRSGDSCHFKDSLLFIVPKKRGTHRKMPGSIRR